MVSFSLPPKFPDQGNSDFFCGNPELVDNGVKKERRPVKAAG